LNRFKAGFIPVDRILYKYKLTIQPELFLDVDTQKTNGALIVPDCQIITMLAHPSIHGIEILSTGTNWMDLHNYTTLGESIKMSSLETDELEWERKMVLDPKRLKYPVLFNYGC